MSAHLLIPDSPLPYWWVSSNIWVVPGADPNGPPGSPVAGLPAYLWARVSNTGNAFHPPSHDQIAQTNLSVLSAGLRGLQPSLNVNATGRASTGTPNL